jgi:hypothetical protein
MVNGIAPGKQRMGLMYVIIHRQLCGMFLYPEDGGNNFLQNIVLNLQKYMIPHPRRC